MTGWEPLEYYYITTWGNNFSATYFRNKRKKEKESVSVSKIWLFPDFYSFRKYPKLSETEFINTLNELRMHSFT